MVEDYIILNSLNSDSGDTYNENNIYRKSRPIYEFTIQVIYEIAKFFIFNIQKIPKNFTQKKIFVK